MALSLQTLGGLILATILSSAASAQPCIASPTSALTFDGATAVVTVPSPTPNRLDGFHDFTIECVFRTTVVTPLGEILIAKEASAIAARPYAFGVRFGRMHLTLNFGGTPTTPFALSGQPDGTDPFVADGLWHHAAALRNGSAVEIYLDGVLVKSGTYGQQLATSTGDLDIGSYLSIYPNSAPGGYFLGDIDEVRIWGIARPQSLLLAYSGCELTGYEPGLAGYWKCNEGSGQIVSNSARASGIALDGVLGTDLTTTSDPQWLLVGSPVHCCAYGQANQAASRLLINGIGGPDGSPGPFAVTIPSAGSGAYQLAVDWSGPPGCAITLGYGVLMPSSFDLGSSGTLDLELNSLGFIFDGNIFPYSLLFVTGNTGQASQLFTVPPTWPSGVVLNVQGAISQSGFDFPLHLTAAFQISL